MTTVRLRIHAARYLNRIIYKGAYLNIILTTIFSSQQYNHSEKAYLHKTLNGVIIWHKKYEWIVSRFSSVPINKIERKILLYIFIALQNLLEDERIPDYSAINEIVEAVKKENGKKAANFANGILRAVQRDIAQIPYPDKIKEPVENLSIRFSHPAWMVERWVNRYGFRNTEKICSWNNRFSNETTIRINTLKTDIQQFIGYCRENGHYIKKWKQYPRFYQLKNLSSLLRSHWYDEGYFVVQTVSSGIPPLVLNPGYNSVIADICAAPGGKTSLLAEYMRNTGNIIAVDSLMGRLRLVRENIHRLGIKNVALACADGRHMKLRNVDGILLDVPCSGLGILNQKPDIRWKRKPEQVDELSVIQLNILSNTAKCVKPGGILVYSTCTIEPEENEQVVDAFLKTNKNFVAEPLQDIPYTKLLGKETNITILPFIHNLNGSFIAKLRRIM